MDASAGQPYPQLGCVGYIVEDGTKGTKIINPTIAATIAIAFLFITVNYGGVSNNFNQLKDLVFTKCVRDTPSEIEKTWEIPKSRLGRPNPCELVPTFTSLDRLYRMKCDC